MPPYRMPQVEIGLLVLWYPDGNLQLPPHCGVVTRVSAQSLCINCFDPMLLNVQPRDGVKHVGDPTLRREEARAMGGWDYTPAYRRLLDLEFAVKELLNAQRESPATPTRPGRHAAQPAG